MKKLVFAGFVASSAVFAAGFEKNVLWSGKYQGRAGAATSSVDDSEGLFFNPAGLAFLESRGDVHLNFSPTWSTAKGPLTADGQSETASTPFSPIFGLTSAYRINKRFVVGLGEFVSGGTEAVFDYTSGPQHGTIESSLQITETVLGAAYRINNEFSVGADWRITHASANLSSFDPGNTLEFRMHNLDAWNFAGFRVGAQYRKENFGLGLNMRTPIKLKLTGDITARPLTSDSSIQSDSGSASATFPFQVALGGDYKLSPSWRLYADVSWTNYSADQQLNVDAGSAGPVLDGLTAAGIPLKWHDMEVFRLGVDWQAFEHIVLRAGYALTTQVTNTDYARATFSSPGIGNDITVGAGAKILDSVKVNGALDYSFSSGSKGSPSDATSTGNSPAYSGTYSLQAYSAHLGASYNW